MRSFAAYWITVRDGRSFARPNLAYLRLVPGVLPPVWRRGPQHAGQHHSRDRVLSERPSARPGRGGLAYWVGTGLPAKTLLEDFAQSTEFINNTNQPIINFQNLEAAGTPVTTGSLFAVPDPPGGARSLSKCLARRGRHQLENCAIAIASPAEIRCTVERALLA